MVLSRRILLADDDESVRFGIEELLLDLGLEVHTAETGPEALEVARSVRIHAAVLDVHMPGCTGLDCLPIPLDQVVGLPCILYSGNLTRAIERTALSAGAFSVLAKPVQPELFRTEVLRALATWPES